MVLLRSAEISKFVLLSRCAKHLLRRRLLETHRLDSSRNYRNDRYGSLSTVLNNLSSMAAFGRIADASQGRFWGVPERMHAVTESSHSFSGILSNLMGSYRPKADIEEQRIIRPRSICSTSSLRGDHLQ